MDFVERCARAAGLDLASHDVEVDQRGMQHLVLLDHGTGSAYRFPRTAATGAKLQDAAVRLDLLGRIGLPVPSVLTVRESPDPGEGFLHLSLMSGQALDTVATDAMSPPARARLVGELADLIDRLGQLPVDRWPGDPADWARIWAELAAETVGLTGLPVEVQAHAQGLAATAAATAASAPIRVFHGDLGGVNCRVDAETGSVTAMLDWDAAALGDPATDVAALLSGLGPDTAAAARSHSPGWVADEQRYTHYVATWPLQFYLWSARSGSPDERQRARGMLSEQARSAAR